MKALAKTGTQARGLSSLKTSVQAIATPTLEALLLPRAAPNPETRVPEGKAALPFVAHAWGLTSWWVL